LISAGGDYSAPTDALAVLRGLLLRGGGEEGGKGGRKEEEREGEGIEEEGKGFAGPMSNCFLRACMCSVNCNRRLTNSCCNPLVVA